MEVERISDVTEISFPKLGWTFHIDPTAFTVFGLQVQWYGIIITLGMILAFVYCLPRLRRFGLDLDRAADAVIGGVIGGIIGARIYYVIWKWEDYAWDWKAIVNTRNGGLAIYGGIIGAIAVGLLICKFRKVKYLPMLDVTVLGLLIGQGVGRWGNFVNQEAFGTNTDFFLGMTGGRIQDTIISQTQIGGDMYQSGIEMYWEKTVHPCFLYESLWCLLGFVILSWFSKRRKYDGQILLMYMAWYGAERFVVEGLRTDSLYIGNIRVSQAVSAIIFVVSVIIQIVMFFRIRRDPESYELYCSTEESRLLIEESRRKRLGLSAEDIKIGADDDDEGDFDDDDESAFDDDEDDDSDDYTSPEEDGGSDDEDESDDDAPEEDNDSDEPVSPDDDSDPEEGSREEQASGDDESGENDESDEPAAEDEQDESAESDENDDIKEENAEEDDENGTDN